MSVLPNLKGPGPHLPTRPAIKYLNPPVAGQWAIGTVPGRHGGILVACEGTYLSRDGQLVMYGQRWIRSQQRLGELRETFRFVRIATLTDLGLYSVPVSASFEVFETDQGTPFFFNYRN